ncbi:hypothetical protein M8C21_019486 [Ambrosia artemisiifolia]|uniref:Axial regulator YABBY 1 n=1 Tax=Ambrosia artemisiifolia TaxID=4212 RepID=A0AAD5GI03_AMBAR|nr:hypothetical protein M8C21_019486 [Ambrosia artemisiifolia]
MSSAAFSPDLHHHHHLPPPSEQLCYVQCNFCETVLAVSVPCTIMYATVTVRCGHCTNLLSEELRNNPSNLLINQPIPDPFGPIRVDELLKPPVVNRPPEKRQRVPSAYNRFIKEEIQRIKAGNPEISHREAFSAAAKNWAHFPHIHFGLMPDQTLKNPDVCQQKGDDLRTKDTLLTAGNMDVSPY